MQQIVPSLWFDGDAVAGGELYVRAFPKTTSQVDACYPTEGLAEFQQPLAGQPLLVGVQLGDFRLTLTNAGAEFRPNPAASLMVNFDPLLFDGDADAARRALDQAWAALSESGTIRMPIGEYPFSPHYGWVEDRFGVNWQLILTNPQGDPRPFVIPSLLFVSDDANVAHGAVDFYVDTFTDARIGTMVPRSEQADSVMFCDFQIQGSWFTAMDGSSSDHDFGFTPGVSFQVNCANQAEIDRLWDALSAVPEAEQCGWLQDRYGVSWQILPANLPELMQRPNAFEHMMGMKKLVVADF